MDEKKYIYLIYAVTDARLVSQLVRQLDPFLTNRDIFIWDDDPICKNQTWKPGDSSRLARADYFLLFPSTDFMYSEFLKQIEFKRIIDRYREGKATVVPVILEECPWQIDFEADDYTFNFNELEVLPENRKPFKNSIAEEEVLQNVVKRIGQLVTGESREEIESGASDPEAKDQLALKFAEESDAKRVAKEERLRKQGEMEARQKAEKAKRAQQEEARRKAEEAEAKRVAEEERLRKQGEMEARQKALEAKRAQQEEARRKAEEAEAKRVAEEERLRKQGEMEARQKAEEAERAQQEVEARRKAEEAEAKRVAEEERLRKQAEMQARQKAEEAERAQQEIEARRKAEEAEAKRVAEEERLRKQDEIEAQQKAQEAKRAEQEIEARRKAEEQKFQETIELQGRAEENDNSVDQNAKEKGNAKKKIFTGSLIAVLLLAAFFFLPNLKNDTTEGIPAVRMDTIEVKGPVAPDKKEMDSGTDAEAIPKLAIGDVYGKGIVFEISDDGKSGKMAHLDDAGPMTWKEAMKLDAQFGEGWRLPTLGELKAMYKTIGQGADNRGKFTDELYWSATPYDRDQARMLRFQDGNTSFHYNRRGTHRRFLARPIKDFAH